jgi:hypothetical protein
MMFPSETRLKNIRSFAIIGFVASLVVLPMLFLGMPLGNDLPQHYQFAQTFSQALADGSIYPSWSSTVNNGLGDVGVRFYPPASYYPLGIFYTATGSWFFASILVFWLWFFVGGVGVYLWARHYFGENASAAAAIFFTVAPYHVNQLYNAFTYAEFSAAGILPFCFLYASRVCRREARMLDIVCLGVAYALLVLTHLPMALMGSIALLVYCIFSLPSGSRIATVARLSSAVFFGLCASAFYWARMVTELSYIKHATAEFVSDAYDYRSNFLLSFFTAGGTDYIDRSLWFGDLLLLATAAMFIPAALAYRRASGGFVPLDANVAVVAVCLFMASPASILIWNNFETLQKIQFPWRWMGPLTVASSLFVAAGFETISKWFRSARSRPFAITCTGLFLIGIAFTAAQIIKPAVYVEAQEFERRVATLETATSCECWWPVWAKKSAVAQHGSLSAEGRTVTGLSRTADQIKFEVEPGASAVVRTGIFYYPLWKATVNGLSIEVEIDENGILMVPVTSEHGRVVITFEESMAARLGALLSVLTWISLLAAAVFLNFRDRRTIA